MRPSQLEENQFPFSVKIFHAQTGHVYIRPVNNLKPFTDEQELEIVKILDLLEIGAVRNTVKANFTTAPTKNGFGFRIFQK